MSDKQEQPANGAPHEHEEDDDQRDADFGWVSHQLSLGRGGRRESEDDESWDDPTGGALSCLLEAIDERDEEMAKSVLEEQKDLDVSLPGPDGDTALHMAALMGLHNTVKLLLSRGAKADAKNEEDGSLPHHDAAASGQLDILKTLTDATGPEALKVLDTDGESPLHLAARGNHLDIVKYLLEKGADPKAKNAEERTPAEEAEHQAVVELLKSHI